MENLAARIILLWGWRRAMLALLAGAFGVLAQAPIDFFPAGFVSFTILVWLLDGATADDRDTFWRRQRVNFAIGWWFGFGYFVAGLWWVGQALLVDAEEFAWALPLAVIGLPAGLAIFYGLASTVARLCWSNGIGRIAALAFGFGIAEWLRATVLTGFPWNAVGYAAMPVPLLMQSVQVTGMYGMNALAVFIFALPALLASDRHRRTGLFAGLVLAAAHVGFGYYSLSRTIPVDKSLSVRIVQPSIPQGGKWDPEYRDNILATLLELSAKPPEEGGRRPELIVWPETALPFLFTDRPDALAAVGDMLQDGQKLFLGAVRSEGAGAAVRYYNSVIAIDDAGEIVDAVDKVHLVPFGEYLPLQVVFDRLGMRAIADNVGGFSAGAERGSIAVTDAISAVPFICYEVIFPGEVVADDADLIVNLTNDAWFGDTPGPYQHFRQAQLRAVETARPMVRAANNGISAVIDSRGRVVDAFAQDAVGALDVNIQFSADSNRILVMSYLNGILIILFFAIVACGTNAFARIRSG
ncbi:apolipoprotein N-acyltransferase [Aquibium oceanicum]|uniref:Apolipoprotein N-acyltransferase n=1 Tax=Aquibium oceanicum TaxID=1670800 RepID=A0A1L3SMD6_9HYPH|nr:apolipoprotein N-acyltransferase [Aquibium oceanicum]APH70568.1 apolipoprotein N-acyltransferase [Aquibium oceanicum]